MTSKTIWIIAVLLLIIGAGFLYQSVPSESEIKVVNMINNKGESVGTINLSETKAGILFNLDLNNLTPNGEHAIHVHEKGDCTPLKTFKNAGGHFNPAEKKHGMKHPDGHHAGDMPNLKPDANGKIQTAFVNLRLALEESEDGRHSVYDDNGSSIMIHAGADDHMSQPSGAAGGRIACGVIQ